MNVIVAFGCLYGFAINASLVLIIAIGRALGSTQLTKPRLDLALRLAHRSSLPRLHLHECLYPGGPAKVAGSRSGTRILIRWHCQHVLGLRNRKTQIRAYCSSAATSKKRVQHLPSIHARLGPYSKLGDSNLPGPGLFHGTIGIAL